MGKVAIASITGGMGLFAVLCLVWAFRIHEEEKASTALDTNGVLAHVVDNKTPFYGTAKDVTSDVEGQPSK